VISYFECWKRVAAELFSQALAGEPSLSESGPVQPTDGYWGFTATLSGDDEGAFTILLDPTVLESPLMGEGMDQKAAWSELLHEACDAAAGDLLAKGGRKVRVVIFEEAVADGKICLGFQLKSEAKAWTVLVRDTVRTAAVAAKAPPPPEPAKSETPRPAPAEPAFAPPPPAAPEVSPGVELLLDVELEASLRFGCREMPLGEILDLGPGDVVQLDRHVTDPVDLIVGDKIVARGEVVLVNGNFGLRVTEVAAPRKRLESIRCLF
jgi:flagellar motor switch protein FliN/FliY